MKERKMQVPKEVQDLARAVESATPVKKRRRNGGEFGVRDPKIGEKTRFTKEHPRPGPGRPGRTPMTDEQRKLLVSRLPAKYAKALGLPKSSTWAKALAWTGYYDLLKNPDPDKLEKYTQRTDGPLVTEISGSQGGPIPLDLDAGTEVTVHEQLRTVTARLRDRLAKTVTES
jgi:hypothetical protein